MSLRGRLFVWVDALLDDLGGKPVEISHGLERTASTGGQRLGRQAEHDRHDLRRKASLGGLCLRRTRENRDCGDQKHEREERVHVEDGTKRPTPPAQTDPLPIRLGERRRRDPHVVEPTVLELSPKAA